MFEDRERGKCFTDGDKQERISEAGESSFTNRIN